MTDNMSKILRILLYVLSAVSVVIVVVFYIQASNLPPDATHKMQMEELGGILEYFVVWTYILLAIAGIAALLFPILKLFLNPKTAIKTIASLAVFAVIFGIGYSLASAEILVIPAYTGSDNVPSILKLSGTGLFTMYLLSAIAIFGVFFTEIIKVFK